MIRAWPKLVAVLLSVILTGAAHACLCLGMDQSENAAVAVAPDPADPHACCKTDAAQSAPVAPVADDPCQDCNARNAVSTIVPDKAPAAPAPDFSAVVASVIDSHELLALVARPAYRAADDVPIPPLLRDLHHSSVLLTV